MNTVEMKIETVEWTSPGMEEIALSCEIATYAMAEISDETTR